MNSDWIIVLVIALSNVGSYLFSPAEKKREAGAQAITSSLALLCGFCVARFVLSKLTASGTSLSTSMLLMFLAFGVVYLIIGAIIWRLFQKFLRK